MLVSEVADALPHFRTRNGRDGACEALADEIWFDSVGGCGECDFDSDLGLDFEFEFGLR
jgi:hypothetical protein